MDNTFHEMAWGCKADGDLAANTSTAKVDVPADLGFPEMTPEE